MTSRPYQLDPTFQKALEGVREDVRRPHSEGTGESSVTRRSAAFVLNALLIFTVIFVLLIGYGLVDNRWYRVVAIQGGSMSPHLVSGDAIVLTRAPAELEVGMIVTLEVDGQVVTHRVVSVEDDGTFTTKGDANSVADDWGENDVDVIGIQRARIPLIGNLLTSISAARGSNAWLIDRSTVSGTAVTAECFDGCATTAEISSMPGTGEESTLNGPEMQLSDDAVGMDPTPSDDQPTDDGETSDR